MLLSPSTSFQAKKNDLVLFTEDPYVQMEPGASISGGESLDIDFRVQTAEFGAGYRVATWGNTEVEPILGTRWSYQKLETEVSTGTELIEATEDRWDICGGIRLWTYFNE